MSTFTSATPSLTYNQQYGIAQMPSGPGGSVSVVGGEDLVVPAGSKHAAAAEAFVKYMLSSQAQLEMAKAGQMSVLTSAGSGETALQSYYAPFAQQLLKAQARPPVPNYAQIDADVSNAISAALHHKGIHEARAGLGYPAGQPAAVRLVRTRGRPELPEGTARWRKP